MMSRIVRILAPVAAVSLLVASAPAAGAASYDLSKGSATGMSGVSPFAMEIDGTTDRVFHSAGEAGGWLMSVCTVGGSCTQTSLPPDFGTDFTQVTLADGSQRAYFVIPEMDGSKEIATAPVAYIDGTFFDDGELVGRSLQDVPHPTVLQTLERLASLPESERAKVRFVHLNHTNPLLDPASTAVTTVGQAGCQVARQGERQLL